MRDIKRTKTPAWIGRARSVVILSALLVTAWQVGCRGIEKAPPQPKSVRAERTIEIDAPRIMRGTIASESVLLGYEPVIARGYGLVVGLDGTGSADIPPQLRAHMLEEMARHGIGSKSAGLDHINPTEMLNSLDTAVVIVEAVIPPGAVGRKTWNRMTTPGTRFDVRVRADPRTGTTSLEGGRLYTTELVPVLGTELPPTGSRRPSFIAKATGPIFVNPFLDPDRPATTVNRQTGRILNGGEATKDLVIKLRLATPSHARAELVQNAINTRFPKEPGQRDDTAMGESDEAIRITVPPSYRDASDDFVQLLRHTTIRQSMVEAIATNIQRILKNDPRTAQEASWRWQALGERALPVMRELYDDPEEQPRLAALRAGAKLNDPLVVPPLVAMTESGTPRARMQSVRLLGEIGNDPRVDGPLRALMSDDDMDVRLAAYESLVRRRDPLLARFNVNGKFVVDVIDSTKPMIYISQVGQPRIAIFDRNLSLEQPLVFSGWDGRFMVQAETGAEEVEIYYRGDSAPAGVINAIEPTLPELVRFLGHEQTVERPEPGIDLTYGETVGALYQLWRAGAFKADFKSEQDRVLAEIIRIQEETQIEQRPEFGDVETGGAGTGQRPDFGPTILDEDPLPANVNPALPEDPIVVPGLTPLAPSLTPE